MRASPAGCSTCARSEPYRGYEGPEQFVEIPPGASSLAIGERLVAGGVVRDLQTYRLDVVVERPGTAAEGR